MNEMTAFLLSRESHCNIVWIYIEQTIMTFEFVSLYDITCYDLLQSD